MDWHTIDAEAIKTIDERALFLVEAKPGMLSTAKGTFLVGQFSRRGYFVTDDLMWRVSLDQIARYARIEV